MDIVHVYWWRPSSLPTCRINASFFQTLSDTPWKNVLPALWAPFNTAKMTHKINDHTCVQKLENLKITVQWRKKFRLSFPPRCVCLPINGIEKRKSCSLCLTLWDPMDCSLPGSSVQGILQARILKWVAIPFSRDLPYSEIKPGSPSLKADSLPSEPPRKSHLWNRDIRYSYPRWLL